VTREILKHVYTAERLQPPTSLGAVLGTYSTLWARARSVGYWREVVRSGEYARLGVYAVEAYGIFKVSFHTPLGLSPFFARIVLSMSDFFLQIGEIVGRRSLVGYNLQ
jgi:F-type H+-transporting ATPase subunit g